MTTPRVLAIDPAAALRCAQACIALGAELKRVRQSTSNQRLGDAFGILDSGRVIAAKYEGKLVGPEGSLVVAIDSHVEVLRELQAVFEASAQAYGGTEEATTSSLAGSGG